MKSLEKELLLVREFNFSEWGVVKNSYKYEEIGCEGTLVNLMFKQMAIKPKDFISKSKSTKQRELREKLIPFNDDLTAIWPDNVSLLINLTEKGVELFLVKENEDVRPESCSTGEKWFLTFSIVLKDIVSNKERDTIIVIDEPGLSLHPVAQLSICQMMESFVKEHNTIHLIYSTHSPYMINPRNIVSLFHVVRDEDGGTNLCPVNLQTLASEKNTRRGNNDATEESTKDFLNRIMTDDMIRGIFSKKVILCEGPTERLVLPVYARIKGKNFDNEGFSIIACQSKGSIIDYAEFYRLLKIPIFIIFDNDELKDQNNTKKLNKWLVTFIKQQAKNVEVEEIGGFPIGYGKSYFIFRPKFETALEEDIQYVRFKSCRYCCKDIKQKPLKALCIAHRFEMLEKMPELMEKLICTIFKGK